MTFFSTSFVWLLALSTIEKLLNDIDAAFDRSILHIMQYIMYLQYLSHIDALPSVPRPDKLFTKGLFMKFKNSVSL